MIHILGTTKKRTHLFFLFFLFFLPFGFVIKGLGLGIACKTKTNFKLKSNNNRTFFRTLSFPIHPPKMKQTIRIWPFTWRRKFDPKLHDSKVSDEKSLESKEKHISIKESKEIQQIEELPLLLMCVFQRQFHFKFCSCPKQNNIQIETWTKLCQDTTHMANVKIDKGLSMFPITHDGLIFILSQMAIHYQSNRYMSCRFCEKIMDYHFDDKAPGIQDLRKHRVTLYFVLDNSHYPFLNYVYLAKLRLRTGIPFFFGWPSFALPPHEVDAFLQENPICFASENIFIGKDYLGNVTNTFQCIPGPFCSDCEAILFARLMGGKTPKPPLSQVLQL
jgi:hypothetical protein